MAKQPQPFDATHIKVSGDAGRLTWYQQLAINHQSHPGWTTAQHIAALNEGFHSGGDMTTLAALYGTTPEAMIAQALEEATT